MAPPQRIFQAYSTRLPGRSLFPRSIMLKPVSQIVRTGHVPILMILVTVGTTMFQSVRLPTLEEAVCRTFYAEHRPSLPSHANPHDCGISAIQARLASLTGWMEYASALQGLILTLPYAWLAEKVQKRTLLLVGFTTSIASMTYFFAICRLSSTSVHLDMVILAYVFECVGGGISVAYILLYSLLAEATPVETRTSVFYIVGAMLLLTRAATMTFCGILLKHYPWAISLTTVMAYALNIPVVALSSCTPSKRSPELAQEDNTGLLADEQRNHSHDHGDAAENDTNTPNHGIDSNTTSLLQHCKNVLMAAHKEYLGRPIFLTSLLICGIKIIGLDVQFIQPQWSVKRFGWTFSAVSYVNAYATWICMLVLLALPSLSSYLLGKLGSPRRMEIAILQLSLALRIIGTIAMGIAPTRATFLVGVAVQAFSAGTYDTFKAFLTGLCSMTHVAELYAVISLVETAAHMLSSRMWANILVVSLDLEGVQMGLPFWVSAIFSSLALALIRFMAVKIASLPTNNTI